MDTLSREQFQALIANQPGRRASIYTQTQRGGSEQNIIRFRHQLDAAEEQLKKLGAPEGEASRAFKAARAVLKDVEYWKNMSDGLATFLQGDACQMYRLPLTFDSEVFAGSHFQIKPLISWFADEGRFYVLAISQNHVRLLECGTHGVRPVSLRDAPANKEEALRTHDRDEILNLHSQHGAEGAMMQAVFHGHGVGIDDRKTELTQYFQKIDRALCRALPESRAPLVLATVDYLAAIYQKVSKYPRVLDAGVYGNPDHVSDENLRVGAQSLAEPFLREREERALAQYRQMVGTGKTTYSPSELLPAAWRGELETLLLVKGNRAWGRFDPATSQLEEHREYHSGDEDLTNLAATYMLRHGRQVFEVAAEPGFDGAPMAGIYFLPMDHHGKSRR